MRPRQIDKSTAAITSGTISGTSIAATALSTTGALGVGTASPAGSLDVAAIATNPGTVSVAGTAVTGTSTTFTKTFKVGDSITTTTSSGSETKAITIITSDTAMATASFAGVSANTAYTSSNSGSQWTFNASGQLRMFGGTSNVSATAYDVIYKADTVSFSGANTYCFLRDATTINSTGGVAIVNALTSQTIAIATGSGSFSSVRGLNASLTIGSTNTGNVTNFIAALANPTVTSGAAGTVTTMAGVSATATNSSSGATVTNLCGGIFGTNAAVGAVTNSIGIAVGAKAAVATNSAIGLFGTTTAPSGNWGIYNVSAADNAFAGNSAFGGTTAPTAKAHIAAGTATAGTAPLKLTAGTNLTTPEAGAIEFDGANYFVTAGSTRFSLAKALTGSATLDFPNTPSGSSSDLTITVTGAAESDPVDLGVPNAVVLPDSVFFAWVSAANTVTVRFDNTSGAAKNPGAGLFKVVVHKF
jgi:hypothetical protein